MDIKTPPTDDADPNANVSSVKDIEVDRHELDRSIADFVDRNPDYYARAFHTIHDTTAGIPRTLNWAAALFGPFWSAARGIWGFFWAFLILEIVAWVQIGRGTWGELGADAVAQAERQTARAQEFLQQAQAARDAGEDPGRFETLAGNLMRAAERSRETADAAAADAFMILMSGLVLLLVLRLVQGIWSNVVYEKQYSRWRVAPDAVPSGFRTSNIVFGVILGLVIMPLTVYRFTIENVPDWLTAFPANPDHYGGAARWLEAVIDDAARGGAGAFDGIRSSTRSRSP